MTEVTFFHHERDDGALRTGLTVEGARALEFYQPGADDWDPKLRWYIDVNWPTATPPASQEAAVAWWATRESAFRDILTRVADDLQAGVDPAAVPYHAEYPGPEGAVRVTASALTRYAHDLGRRIRRQLLDDWPRVTDGLRPYVLAG